MVLVAGCRNLPIGAKTEAPHTRRREAHPFRLVRHSHGGTIQRSGGGDKSFEVDCCHLLGEFRGICVNFGESPQLA